jgi:hypothetical protein
MRTLIRTALALLAALALVTAACGDDDKEDGGAGGGAAQQPDPATLARQAADAVEALTSFHFLLEHENGGTPIVLNLTMNRAEGDIVKPDRISADVEAVATQLGNANVKVRVVNVGTKGVISNPFNARQYLPLPENVQLRDIVDPGAGVTKAMRAAQNLRITGEESVNGVATWRLEGEIDAGELRDFASVAEPGYKVKGIAWVGKEKPLVHRVRLEGPLGAKDAPNIVRKVDLSKFDENFNIVLPAGSTMRQSAVGSRQSG